MRGKYVEISLEPMKYIPRQYKNRKARYPFPSGLVKKFQRGESKGWGSVLEHCHLQHYIFHTQQLAIIATEIVRI